MKKSIKQTAAVLMAAAIIATGCSSGSTGSESASKLDAIKESGKITMYTNAEFPPYEFVRDDKIVGVDVEIAEKIAEKIGVELEIVNAEFAGIVASISSGKGDMALSGITINETRKEAVDFSVPYVDSVQYIILSEQSPIEVLEDVADKTIGGQTGTTGIMLVEDEINDGVLTDKNVTLKDYNSAPIAMADLAAGRIEAVVIDEFVAIEIAKANPGYKAIPLVYEDGAPLTEQFGVAIAKGNEDLLAIIDEVVEEMVANGDIDKYMEEYSE